VALSAARDAPLELARPSSVGNASASRTACCDVARHVRLAEGAELHDVVRAGPRRRRAGASASSVMLASFAGRCAAPAVARIDEDVALPTESAMSRSAAALRGPRPAFLSSS